MYFQACYSTECTGNPVLRSPCGLAKSDLIGKVTVLASEDWFPIFYCYGNQLALLYGDRNSVFGVLLR